jgi:hypothetical protein
MIIYWSYRSSLRRLTTQLYYYIRKHLKQPLPSLHTNHATRQSRPFELTRRSTLFASSISIRPLRRVCTRVSAKALRLLGLRLSANSLHPPSSCIPQHITMSADPRRRPAPAQSAPPPPPPPPPPVEAQPDSTAQSVDGVGEQNRAPEAKAEESFKLRFCTVCASNNNRYVSPRDVVYRPCVSPSPCPATRRVTLHVLLVPLSLHNRIYSPQYKASACPSLLCLSAIMTLLPLHQPPY